MTLTLISLISILTGIMGAYLTAFIFKKYSFGIIGNTIAGVFGSIFFIKSIGRFGIDPNTIMESGEMDIIRFGLNLFISLIGGGIAVFLAYKIKKRMNKDNTA